MGQKDLSEKILESYNDVFADIVNGLLFKGVQRVVPQSLSDDLVHTQYRAEDGKLHEEERDVLKRWKDKQIDLAIMGLENQTDVERLMPLRVIGYDGATYRNQLLNKVSGPAPVITLILYFGTKHRWNQPRHLKELFPVSDELTEFINDYKINVFEIAWLSEDEIEKFRGDFKIVANFFRKKRLDRKYCPDDNQEIQHVDAVLKLLSAMTGDVRYEQVLRTGKEVKTMCDVAERLEKQGINLAIYKLVAKGKLTPEEGAEELGIAISDLEEAMKEAGFTMPDLA